MLRFRTELTPTPVHLPLEAGASVVAIGSCFAERMGGRLVSAKFRALVNPFGTVYHPLAMLRLMQLALAGEPLPEAGIRRHPQTGLWHSFDAHSLFNAPSREALRAHWEAVAAETRAALLHADALMLTFGTALGRFRQGENEHEGGILVANCHQYPAALFTQQMASVPVLTAAYTAFLQHYTALVPRARIIVTVSPVRHVRDTLPVNAVSKSVLRLLCHELETHFSQVAYFPAYELLLDDLRDYRFYGDDLIHPSAFAEQYIWGKFAESCFSSDARAFMARWEKLRVSLAHRPFNPATPAHRAFLEDLRGQLLLLGKGVSVAEEVAEVERRLRENYSYGSHTVSQSGQ